ncbi:hypothetical protein PQI51_06490 [Microbacterium esteraromaticum]|uniref:hypothetical protein n=1 Tax=Microbacterium esteraromaticum TaxID=57043 RepID=UPI0030A651D2
MLNEAESLRRRELQRLAFAAGGGLDEVQLAELRELDARAAARSVTPPPPAAEPESAVQPPAVQPPPGVQPPIAAPALIDSVPQPETAASESVASDQRDPEPADAGLNDPPALSGETARRRLSIPVLVLSATVAVLLGVGIGWLGFGRAAGGHAMTDAQRATLVQLDSSNEFDPGSIEFVGAKHGVEAWYATKDLDENECLVLVADETAAGAEDAQTTACQKTGASDTFGLQTNLELTVDGERVMIWAVLLDDTDGDRVTVIQREVLADDGTYDWRSQYSGPELDIAEFLDVSGYDGDSLQLIGWDDTTPVWMTFDGSEVCMLVAEPTALIGEACAEFDSAVGSRIEMSTAAGVYQLNLTQNLDPRLTIIRTPDSIICDIDSGYCGVDDKTGGTGG